MCGRGTKFYTGSSFFLPRDQLPDEFSSTTDKGWFVEGRYVTRRFAFDPKVIDILKDRARSECVPNLTAASRRVTSESPKLCVDRLIRHEI